MAALTPKDAWRIKVLTQIKNETLTNDQAAERFSCSVPTIGNIKRWGKANRIYDLESNEKLQMTIVTLQKRLDWLEKQRLAHQRMAKARALSGAEIKPVSVAFLSAYMREGRETAMAIAELEGLIRRSLNVNLGDGNGGPARIVFEVVHEIHDGTDQRSIRRVV